MIRICKPDSRVAYVGPILGMDRKEVGKERRKIETYRVTQSLGYVEIWNEWLKNTKEFMLYFWKGLS